MAAVLRHRPAGTLSAVSPLENPESVNQSNLINAAAFTPDFTNLLETFSPNEEELAVIQEMIELNIITPSEDIYEVLGQINNDTVTTYVMTKYMQSLSVAQDEKDCLAIYVPGMSLVVDYFYSEIPAQPGQ